MLSMVSSGPCWITLKCYLTNLISYSLQICRIKNRGISANLALASKSKELWSIKCWNTCTISKDFTCTSIWKRRLMGRDCTLLENLIRKVQRSRVNKCFSPNFWVTTILSGITPGQSLRMPRETHSPITSTLCLAKICFVSLKT